MADIFRCGKCKKEKPREGFFKDSRDRRGIRTHECKDCSAVAKRVARGPEPPGPLPKEVTKLFNEWVRRPL